MMADLTQTGTTVAVFRDRAAYASREPEQLPLTDVWHFAHEVRLFIIYWICVRACRRPPCACVWGNAYMRDA